MRAGEARIAVGVHVHAEPDVFRLTLELLKKNTSLPVQLLVLADGPEPEINLMLDSDLRDLRSEVLPEATGAAACFNRLTKLDAEFYVLLESGSLVGPGWLDHLLSALHADPRNGLVGPCTNRSWNEQCIFPDGPPAKTGVEELAALAAQLDPSPRILTPLYSLADFCYGVRRAVVEHLERADEGYGLGPCWEMDYNIRAARAGFRGVWAPTAYVHRLPFTARRAREEHVRFESSRRRYQDKFCGLRLRNLKRDYRPHCSGDACPNYAPAEYLGILRVPVAHLAEPEVTCIMPTYNRKSFIARSIRCFLAQDYPRSELIIVDDGDPIQHLLPPDKRIRYIRVPRQSIGAKRNLACAFARGDIIVHWDDDDWYPEWRVRRVVESLINGADICGSSTLYYFDSEHQQAFRYEYTDGHVPWLAGNTLAYWRRVWERNRFPEKKYRGRCRVSAEEQAMFLCRPAAT